MGMDTQNQVQTRQPTPAPTPTTPGELFSAEMKLQTLAFEHLAAWEDHAQGADSALQFAKFCLWLADQINALYLHRSN